MGREGQRRGEEGKRGQGRVCLVLKLPLATPLGVVERDGLLPKKSLLSPR